MKKYINIVAFSIIASRSFSQVSVGSNTISSTDYVGPSNTNDVKILAGFFAVLIFQPFVKWMLLRYQKLSCGLKLQGTALNFN